ncbi:MAG: alpha/beta fold hydrolase [Cyclobacteriaceae bacterium]
MKLNFRTLGEGQPLIILHGLFGSADNWQTLGKEFAKNFKVYLVDLRNHGNSPHSDEFNYDLLSEDLKELIDDEGLQKVLLLGHSMGGKTAMTFATSFPEMVDKLIVVDIGPKKYPPHHENVYNGFHSVDMESLASRKDADDQLSKTIGDFGIRQFILKNLSRNSDGSFEWKINLDSLTKNAHEVGRPLDASDRFEGATLFIGGAKSGYIKTEDHDLIKSHFPMAQIEMIEGAGHWVHAEKPRELYQTVIDFLS